MRPLEGLGWNLFTAGVSCGAVFDVVAVLEWKFGNFVSPVPKFISEYGFYIMVGILILGGGVLVVDGITERKKFLNEKTEIPKIPEPPPAHYDI